MKPSRAALGLAFTFAFTSGCASYIPFTQELRSEHQLRDEDLKNLQFYNSHTITLRREVSRDGREVTSGHKLLVIAGKQIEEIVIEKHTPGIVVRASNDALEVSFDEGTSLPFVLQGSRSPAPSSPNHGAFVGDRAFAEPPEPDPFPGREAPLSLPVSRWAGSGSFWLTSGESVAFQGLGWTPTGETLQTHLVISTESLEEVDEHKTVLKGRKL